MVSSYPESSGGNLSFTVDRAYSRLSLEFILLFLLILVNGIFAMAEIGLVASRTVRLKLLAEGGDESAKAALRLRDDPTKFLSTVQIGITAIGILNGIVGEAVFAEPLSELLQMIGLGAGVSSVGATAIVVISITYLTIVFGELVPKRIAQFNAEGVARVMAKPLAALAKFSSPFVWILSTSTDGVLKMLGKGELSSANVTEEDIHAVLFEGSRSGAIEQQEHDMVRNVFRLDDRQIASLMTPRSEITYLDLDESLEASLHQLIASDHTRYPVCRGGLHDIRGVITAKRLFRQHLEGHAGQDITPYLLPAVYVPESLTGMKLLEQFRESGMQMVFVVDEYGDVVGLITLQDLLQALAGEFKPADPSDVWAVQRDDGSWLLDGLMPVLELQDTLGLTGVPDEERAQYHTLSGMIMWMFGRVPETGDMTEWQGWVLEVVDLDGNRIDKVLAYRDETIGTSNED